MTAIADLRESASHTEQSHLASQVLPGVIPSSCCFAEERNDDGKQTAGDRDRGDVGQLPAVGQLCPVFDDAIAVLARTEHGWHIISASPQSREP